MKKAWLSYSAAAGVAAVMVMGSQVSTAKEKAPPAVPGEIIVGMPKNFSESGVRSFNLLSKTEMRKSFRMALFHALGPNAIDRVHGLHMDDSIQKVVLKDASKTQEAIEQIRTSMGEAVQYVEPNYIYTTQMGRRSGKRTLEPNDVDWSKQWDMKNIGQVDKASAGQPGAQGADINVTPVWGRGFVGDRRMVVAVIDTGIDYHHPDLAANIFKNEKEIPDNGIDDDENGVVDDVYGASFVSGTGVGNGLDDHSHGTHCAGTIGAVGNDGFGMSGVNWEVRMLPVKFLSASGGGTLEGAINAVKYATKMGAKVLSNSWGGGGFSQALSDAIQESSDAGALFIAAAGNDGTNNDVRPTYPASYEIANVIAVAATDNRDVIASFSNYGKRTVHVAAPGKNILSTVKDVKYDTYSGTSMATPHVSGIAALLWAAKPKWKAAQIKERLITTSTAVPGLRRLSVSRGRVNAFNALANIVTPNDDPIESDWEDVDYALESDHPYVDNKEQNWEISAPGAKFIRVVFERFETEARYDTLTLESNGEVFETLSGTKEGEYVSDFVQGERVTLKFKSDTSKAGYGFKVSKIQIVEKTGRDHRQERREEQREKRAERRATKAAPTAPGQR